MLRSILLSFILLFTVPFVAHAEISAADSADIDGKIQLFVQGVNASKTKDALYALFVPKAKEKSDMMNTLVVQLDNAVNYTGRPLKVEMVEQKELGAHMIYRRYIMYSNDIACKLDIVFFKSSAGWLAQSLYFNDLAIDDFNGQ